MPTRGSRDPLVCPRFIRQMMGELSQTALADRLGMTQGFVSKVLSGQQPVALEAVEAWSAALELTADQAALLTRYAIRSYGPACANDLVDALDEAKLRQDALDGELATLRTTVEVQKRYAEALERELANLRGPAAGEERRSG
jgi:transcriptional regulator with XRE-family HTH domain